MTALRLLSVAFLVVSLWPLGCSTVPTYRPPIPLPGNRQLEVGAGLHGAGTAQAAGPGATAWALFRTDLETMDLDVFGSAHVTQLVAYDGSGLTGPFAGGNVGLRTRMTFLPDLLFAAEAAIDYLEDQRRPAAALRHITGLVRLPVAQRVTEGVWVYIAPTLGISIPLYENPELPLFGIQEMPLGVSWTFHPDFTLVAEGGLWGGSLSSLESAGGYGGVALMFHPF